jgi:hypothetical protein
MKMEVNIVIPEINKIISNTDKISLFNYIQSLNIITDLFYQSDMDMLLNNCNTINELYLYINILKYSYKLFNSISEFNYSIKSLHYTSNIEKSNLLSYFHNKRCSWNFLNITGNICDYIYIESNCGYYTYSYLLQM